MSDSDRNAIDGALARFLDGEPEPGDGALLAEAMRSDRTFASEVSRLLMVDDLLRQCAVPDDRAFLEALEMRLADERGGGAFLQEFERRVRRDAPPARSRRPWLRRALATAATILAAGLAVLLW